MKGTKKIIAFGMAIVLLLSFTACSKGMKAYDKDALISLLQDKLSISEGDILVTETDGSTGTPAATVITAKYNNARINVSICKDAKDAAAQFKKSYDEFQNNFNKSSRFKGKYISLNEPDSGYIVINGDSPETSVFGDRFRTGSVYGGLYFTGSQIIIIIPEGMESSDDVGKIIDALGYPNV